MALTQDNLQKNETKSDEISFADLVSVIKSTTRYLKSKWVIISFFAILGALTGFIYAHLSKPTYTAVCTFVLEDARSGGLGQYAGLASLAGMNLGDAGGSGGIFQGDNILELYKSRSMIEKTLLSKFDFDNKKELLINRYINSYNLRKNWKRNGKAVDIEFNGDPDHFNRKQDSIITGLVELFNKKLLNVTKPDKKLNIIYVQVISKDELFSKCFTEKLVQNVNDFYVQTKTKKAYQNVQILQHQADSVRAILNSSINGVASAIDAAPNANPLISTLRVNSQKKQIDVQANTAMYSTIVQNLELAKISYRQEAPLIQIIDKPVLPLAVNQISKLVAVIVSALIFSISLILILLIKKFLSGILK